MNHDGSGPGQPAVASGSDSGKALLIEGRHREALESFAEILRMRPDDGEAVDGAARALIELVREGKYDQSLDPAGRLQLCRTLILQQSCTVAPPVLHHLIVGRRTMGNATAITEMAAALATALADLHGRGEINANFVLMLLILRSSLGGWISQEEISRLHVEWFHAFKLADLSLPYNDMFILGDFDRNRSDLAGVLGDGGLAAKWLGRASLVQLVVLEWVFAKDLIGEEIRAIVALKLEDGQASPQEVAAAKSLLVRHGWGPQGPDPSFLASLGFDPSLAGLITIVAEARKGVQASWTAGTGGLRQKLFHNRAWQGLQAARHLAAGKAPILRKLGRKPRVAICVSGQLRGYKNTFLTWKRSLLPLLDCDIFVDSWTRIGRSAADPYRDVLPFEGESFTRNYREICLKLGFNEFRDRYPHLMDGLNESGYTTEAEVAAYYEAVRVRLDDESQPQFAGWSNQDKMHGKIESCFNLVAESGREYDLIVRLRPDLPIRMVAFDAGELERFCHQRPVIFADHAGGHQYSHPMIGDQMAIGAPGPMRIYVGTRTTHRELARNGLLQVSPVIAGHSSLAQVCWLHGIAVERVPIRFGKLEAPAPLTGREILALLEDDARDRMDGTDHQLIEAVAADLRGPA